MKQVPISTNVTPPMPVILVGTVVDGIENFMAVGWCTRVNLNPTRIAVVIGKKRHTHDGIVQHGTFSICFPDSTQVEATDYCGIVSGKKHDKSALFTTFKGTLAHAPMIESCSLNLECRVEQTLDYPDYSIFVGEVVNAFAREDVLENGEPVLEKMDPLILTMPDNRYWKLNACAGQAWKEGMRLKKGQTQP